MTMLSGHNTIGELPAKKRPYDCGGSEGSNFPANFKRPKVNAGREFPKGCRFSTSASQALLRKPSGDRYKLRKAQVQREFPKACGACLLPPQLKHIVYGGANVGMPEVSTLDSIQQVANQCGKLSPQVSIVPSKVVSGVESFQTQGVQGEGPRAPEKTSGGLGCDVESVELGLSRDSVNAIDGAAKVSSDRRVVSERVDETKTVNAPSHDSVTAIYGAMEANDVSGRFGDTKLVNAHHEPVLNTGSDRRVLGNMYPPPKIRKGFSAFRKFPPHIGVLDCDSELEDELEGSDQEEMANEVKCTPVIGEGICSEGADMILPPLPYAEVVGDIIDRHPVYPSKITLSPDSTLETISAKNESILVGKSVGAEEGSDKPDAKADHGHSDSTMLKRKWVSDDKPIEGTCQNPEARDVATSDFISLQKPHVTEAFKSKDVKVDSFIASSEDEGADNGSRRLGDDEKELDEHTFSQGASYEKKVDSFIVSSEDEGADNGSHRLGDDEKKLDEHTFSQGASYEKKADSFIASSKDEGADKGSLRLGDDEKLLDEHTFSQGASYGVGIIQHDDSTMAFARQKVRDVLKMFKENFERLSEEGVPQFREKRKSVRMVRRKSVKMVHVEAAMILKRKQKWFNSERLIGAVPGIEIGDNFRYRAELVVVGLHHQFQAGIDYMMKDGVIFATSIVDSGRYANAAESSDVLVYSGVGGNPSVATENKPDDQKLKGGNLALKNSMDKGMPVRVIRGRQKTKALNYKDTYIYDGLYHVTSCKQEIGNYGKLVFMFQLNRLPGQPKLVWELSSMSETSKPCEVKPVVNDISEGKEKMPIPAINTLDNEKPLPFYYLTKMLYLGRDKHSVPIGCNCMDGCSDTEPCLCTSRNGGEIPFNDDGAILSDDYPLIYECGPSCKCPPSCKNRVSQKGIQYQLEIFKTKTHGWGVRSQSYIPMGSFICEYIGELLGEKEAERRRDDEYLFDVGCDRESIEDSGGDAYTIDARYCGNVGRFCNHSCSPNMYCQNVLYDHSNKRFPHVMFFAYQDISPLEELTYDYNYKLDQVLDDDGNIRRKECFCGTSKCVGRMY